MSAATFHGLIAVLLRSSISLQRRTIKVQLSVLLADVVFCVAALHIYITLFRNNKFALNEIFQHNASNFAYI